MEYSLPRDQGLAPVPATPKFASDWICTKCSAHNFSKRFLCYVCNTSRSVVESETNEIQSCDYPTNTVVLIGLDVLTTEETVLKSIASLSNLPMISVKIARDPLTNISKGACYIEMNNVLNAHHLHRKLKELTTPIDGRIPEVKYAKLDGNRPPSQAVSILPKSATGSGKIGNAAIAAAQWSHQSGVETYTLADVPRLAEYSAELYANTPEEKVAYIAYYKKYYKQQISEGHTISLPSDSSSGLAAAQAAVAGTKAANSLAEPPDGSGSSKYPVPDTSQYQYDATSGFYYDPYTTLYFDANSQYYYNSKLSKYLYWDGTRQTYLPTPTTAQVPEMSNASGSGSTTNATIVGAPQPAAKTEDKKKEKDGDDRVKIAKRIAKDMEKWAKTLNQKKEAVKQPNTPAPVGVPPSKTHGGNAASSADIGFAVLERKDHLSTLGNYYNNPVPTRNEFTAPVLAPQPPPAPESDEEDEAAQEDKSHTDWDRLICLLCKRQLGSREALVKHQQMSELHKQNLAAWYSARGLDPDDAQMRKIQYRDRASERRQKYGLPDTPKPSRLKETYIKAKQSVYEQPTAKGIGSSNLGNKLLQKMGWQEGMGLGKSNQGRTSIIEAKPRSSTAGLGTRSSECQRTTLKSKIEFWDSHATRRLPPFFKNLQNETSINLTVSALGLDLAATQPKNWWLILGTAEETDGIEDCLFRFANDSEQALADTHLFLQRGSHHYPGRVFATFDFSGVGCCRWISLLPSSVRKMLAGGACEGGPHPTLTTVTTGFDRKIELPKTQHALLMRSSSAREGVGGKIRLITKRMLSLVRCLR
ncbi:unnamed protein product, partial [Nesidiocoris tenuis]